MGVAAQQKIEVRVRSLPVNLGRVRDQDRELVMRDSRGRLLDIVDAIEVSIVDAGEVDAVASALDGNGLVEKDLDSHLLEARHHQDRKSRRGSLRSARTGRNRAP